METLKLEKSTAKKLFQQCPKWFQETLISSFGAECFAEKVTDRIKTFEDACNEIGINPNSVVNTFDTPDIVAYKKLKIIIHAINEGWIPDWDNTSQKKWYPWFNLSSGFGFSDSYYICTIASTSVGSRLCFETQEKSNYVANQFIDLYKQFLTI